MKSFYLLSGCVAFAAATTFRQASVKSSAQEPYLQNPPGYLKYNKHIAAHTQWKPSQKSARNGVKYIFDLQFRTRDDGTFCSNGYTGNTCTERVCAYGLSSSTSAFVSGGDGIHTPANGGTTFGGGNSHYGGSHSYTECSSQGVCDRLTGECACFAGYQGKGCRRTTCPNDCSGHGKCLSNHDINDQYIGHRSGDEEFQSFSTQFWDSKKTMQCNCDRGFAGHDCSERICPHGDDVLTSCSDENTKDVQEIAINNVMLTQNTGTPYQACNDDGTTDHPDNWNGLELLHDNEGLPNRKGIFTAHFSLSFTDHFGGMYTTSPIAIQNSQLTEVEGCYRENTCMTSAGLDFSNPSDDCDQVGEFKDLVPVSAGISRSECATATGVWRRYNPADAGRNVDHAAATALAVQLALEALPNHAIPSVQVRGITAATSVVSAGDITTMQNAADQTMTDAVLNTLQGGCQTKDFLLEVTFSN